MAPRVVRAREALAARVAVILSHAVKLPNSILPARNYVRTQTDCCAWLLRRGYRWLLTAPTDQLTDLYRQIAGHFQMDMAASSRPGPTITWRV